jgi:hypothetical protein
MLGWHFRRYVGNDRDCGFAVGQVSGGNGSMAVGPLLADKRAGRSRPDEAIQQRLGETR